jgi:hypothetical protein
MNDKKDILYCPHCGNTSVQLVLLQQNYFESYYTIPEGTESKEPAMYTVTKCKTCDEILVYNRILPAGDECWSTKYGDIVFPSKLEFNLSVPTNVRKSYQEALKVRNSSPTAFVILARRVLEEICRDKTINCNNLGKAIKELSEKSKLPEVILEASSLIRVVGNAGAHSNNEEINPLHVFAVSDFIRVIIEYLYVAPAKVNEFKKRFKQFSDKIKV